MLKQFEKPAIGEKIAVLKTKAILKLDYLKKQHLLLLKTSFHL